MRKTRKPWRSADGTSRIPTTTASTATTATGCAWPPPAGAHDVSRERCFLREAYSFGIDFFADMSQTIHRGGPVLWVNQDAERYTNEGCGSFVPQCVGNAVHTQAESYLVMSKDVIDEFVSRTGYEGLQADMDEAAAQCPGDNVYKADTIKELAELQGLDAAVFEATVKRYNELCDKAVDEDFNKDAAELCPSRPHRSTSSAKTWRSGPPSGVSTRIARWKSSRRRASLFRACTLPAPTAATSIAKRTR